MIKCLKKLLCGIIGHNEEYRLDTENANVGYNTNPFDSLLIVPHITIYCKRCNKLIRELK